MSTRNRAAHLIESIRSLSADGMAAVYASHYMEEVEAICKRVAIVDRGRVLACDNLQTLLGRMSADLCLHVSRPSAGFAEKLNGLGRLQAERMVRPPSSYRGNGSTRGTASMKRSPGLSTF